MSGDNVKRVCSGSGRDFVGFGCDWTVDCVECKISRAMIVVICGHLLGCADCEPQVVSRGYCPICIFDLSWGHCDRRIMNGQLYLNGIPRKERNLYIYVHVKIRLQRKLSFSRQ